MSEEDYHWAIRSDAYAPHPSSRAMRLAISIQRNALPQVKVLWSTQLESTTIAQLLDQINEAIPLESDGWGTEDYVVSVNGYECLHFQQVADVLAEDDEVSIAPLRSSDIKARIISGRHQISADGRHLVDGIAFGKPYLKRPNRPPVQIPPRKSTRPNYEEGTTEVLELEGGQRQLRIESIFEDADPSNESEVVGSSELRSKKRKRSVSFNEDSIVVGEARDEHPDTLQNPKKRKSNGEPNGTAARSKDELQIWQDDDSDDDSEDEDFQASESEISEEEIELENAKFKIKKDPLVKHMKKSKSTASLSSSSSSSSSPSSSSSDSSSRSSSGPPSDSSSDSSSNSSSSSSDSSPDSSDVDSDDSTTLNGRPLRKTRSDQQENKLLQEGKQQTKGLKALKHNDQPKKQRGSKDKNQIEEILTNRMSLSPKTVRNSKVLVKASQPSRQQANAPGQGKKETTLRNQRRKDHKLLENLKARGLLPPTAVRKDLDEWRAANAASPSKHDLAFEQRREQLLKSIASGGINVADFQDTQTHSMRESKAQVSGKETTSDEYEGTKQEKDSISDGRSQDHTPDAVMTPQRRAKLDLASSRRLLFGSLGLKTPKSKEEEDALRAKLKNQGERKAIIKATDSKSVSNNVTLSTQDEQADSEDAWRAKIQLSAVECCDDNVELSAPPFPFVQRWDPTQQYQENQAQSRKKSKRKKKKLSNWEDDSIQDSYPDIEASVYDDASQPSVFENQQASTTTYASRVDDTPPLPEDISTLPDLKRADLAIGTVFAFKQLECSEATGWRPEISPYRTATITSIFGNIESDSSGQQGATFRAKLANRDRLRSAAQYDDNGRRVYGRFEAPDLDPDDGDTGMLELDLQDLVEPKRLVATTAASQLLAESQTSVVPDSLPLLDHDLASPMSMSPKRDNDDAHHSSMEVQEDSLQITDVQAAQLPATMISGVESSSNNEAIVDASTGSRSGSRGLAVEASA